VDTHKILAVRWLGVRLDGGQRPRLWAGPTWLMDFQRFGLRRRRQLAEHRERTSDDESRLSICEHHVASNSDRNLQLSLATRRAHLSITVGTSRKSADLRAAMVGRRRSGGRRQKRLRGQRRRCSRVRRGQPLSSSSYATIQSDKWTPTNICTKNGNAQTTRTFSFARWDYVLP